jgi:hypothetical protein
MAKALREVRAWLREAIEEDARRTARRGAGRKRGG